jgi:hypothetical protein
LRTSGAQRLALAAVLCLPALLAGCASTDPIDVPAIYENDPEPEFVDMLFPFLLSGEEEKPNKDETRVWGLWPLYHYKRKGRELQIGTLGDAWGYRRRIDQRGFEKLDVIFPPIMYGHSVDQGTYFSFLPFAGVTKGIIGKSYALWILFPVYLYAEDNRPRGSADPFISHHVLFPFINWVHGAGRSGFHVFPFYSHYEKNFDGLGGKDYERTSVMWPFFTHQRNNLDTSRGEAGAQELWFFFPFYGQSKGPKTTQYTVLFPLYRYYENRSTTLGPYYEHKISLPVFIPFIRWGRGEHRWITEVWPFYGVKERKYPLNSHEGGYDHYVRHFVMWPFARWETHDTDKLEYWKWWALPFVWHYEINDKESGRTLQREWKIWPLFRYKEFPDGRLSVNFLSPFFFNDNPEGAFERIYNPLTRVYERKRVEGGWDRRLYAWGLVQDYENEHERESSFWVHPFLYWNEQRLGGEDRTDYYLFGLFQVHRRDGERSLRFFWLPEWPRWRSDP